MYNGSSFRRLVPTAVRRIASPVRARKRFSGVSLAARWESAAPSPGSPPPCAPTGAFSASPSCRPTANSSPSSPPHRAGPRSRSSRPRAGRSRSSPQTRHRRPRPPTAAGSSTGRRTAPAWSSWGPRAGCGGWRSRAARPSRWSNPTRPARPARRRSRPTAPGWPTWSTSTTWPWRRSTRHDGWPVRLPSDADFCFDPAWGPASDRVAWHEWDVPAMSWDASRIVVADVSADAGTPDTKVVAGGGDDLPDAVSTGQPRFSPDGNRLGFVSDEGGWLNLWAAAEDGTDPKPLLSEEIEHGFPTWGLGQRSFAWSPDGARVAFTRNDDGFVRLCVLDVSSGATRDVARGFHAALSWAGDRLAALYSQPDEPTQIVVYEGDDLAERRTIAIGPVAGWNRLDLPAPEAVTWPAEDGAPVHGRLYRPRRSATGADPPPMLVWIHGGPTSQWPAGFNARFSYFVERGWAVLVPDHRGSTGFGRAYTQAMFEALGRGRRGRHRGRDAGRGRAGLGRRPAHGADRRFGRRIHRPQPARPSSRAVCGRGRPLRCGRSVRPGRDDPPVREALPAHDDRPAAAGGRRLPRAVPDQRGRCHRGAAARAAG